MMDTRFSTVRAASAVVVAWVLIAHAPFAVAKNVTVGPGAISCEEYLGKNTGTLRYMYTSWAQGYLSGMNYGLVGYSSSRIDEMIALPNVDTVEAYVERVCRRDPWRNLDSVVTNLFDNLREEQQNR